MIQTLLMDFDWTTALVRFSINTIFIASMIFIISRQTVLKRFSFTFMMISLIVFFLCYTLKNFDLNLGMALGLFAIFGIIRYRTLPLQTEENLFHEFFLFLTNLQNLSIHHNIGMVHLVCLQVFCLSLHIPSILFVL